MQNHRKRWSDDDLAELKLLILNGFSAVDACGALKRTPAGIVAKAISERWLIPEEPLRGNIWKPYFALRYFHQPMARWASPKLRAETVEGKSSETIEQKESNQMGNIEIKTLIAGVDASKMTDEEIFAKILKLEKQVEEWRKIKTQSVKLSKVIESVEADIAKIVAYVDNR